MSSEPPMPGNVRVFLTIFNRAGFPVLVCAWLAYQQFVANKEVLVLLQGVKETLIQVNDTLNEQNRLLRQRSRGD